MAITIPSYDTVRDQVVAYFRNRFPGKDTHLESFLGKFARAFARTASTFHRSVQNADNDNLPSTKTSTAGLDNFADRFGLPTGTAGVYGRKNATAATGGAGLCTGTNGTTFTDGLLLTAPDGVTSIALSGTVTIPGIPPGTGSISGNFVAVTPGTVGNLATGSVLTWASPPVGGDGSVTLTSPLSGAIDTETNAAVLGRTLSRLQKPPKGGTASDYRGWAETQAGVYRAFDYPLRGGTGTNHTLITAAGTGRGRKPSSAVQTLVTNYITGTSTVEGQRPVTVDGYSTLLPYMVADGSGMAIVLRVTPSLAKYNFDWSRGVTTLTVASYAAGPPHVITTTEALPASLKSAIDSYLSSTGPAPRLQVTAAGVGGVATSINPMVHAVAYNSGAKTITLETTLPTGWVAPSAGKLIYSGSALVTTTATNLLTYVDSLGPSRAGNYADPLDPWEDTCAIFRLAQIALDAADADGTKFAKNVLASTIGGSAVDVQANDTSINGPELLFAQTIIVSD